MLKEMVTYEPVREVERRLSPTSTLARMMNILEAERWLKGTNFREVAFLQRRQGGRTAGAPHPGARKVEWRDA
jgi:hypothetical protein